MGAILLISLAACSEDSNSQYQSAALEGKWQYTRVGTIKGNTEVLTDYEHAAGCTKDYIEIGPANVLKSHEFSNPDCQEFIKTGTWSRTGNSLVVGYPEEPSLGGEILELTANTLKVKYTSSDITDVEILTRIP